MLKLVDIYYDALGAPKTVKEVIYPCFMCFQFHIEVCFGGDMKKLVNGNLRLLPLSQQNLRAWERHYRAEMATALSTEDQEAKRQSVDNVIQKYRQMLYEAEDLESSPKEREEIGADALAIYSLSYNLSKKKARP